MRKWASQTYQGNMNKAMYAVAGAGKIKIGISEWPLHRFENLQAGSPVLLQLLWFSQNCVCWRHEYFVHWILRTERAYSEWFFDTEKTREILAAIQKKPILLALQDLGIDGSAATKAVAARRAIREQMQTAMKQLIVDASQHTTRT